MTTGLKQCSKCGQLKPVTEYRKAARGKNGLRADCKCCHLISKKREFIKDGFKKCGICCEIKELQCFPVRKDAKDGRRGYCQNCLKSKNFEYSIKNKNRNYLNKKKWLENNPQKAAFSRSNWSKKNRPKLNMRDSKRRVNELKATLSWLTAIQKVQIQEMYDVALAKTIQTGIIHEVDHIHPLKGENVCGLHVPWNLQVLTRYENRSKGNKLGQQQ
jgi:hypothetical protein